jgi:DNA-binding MarR family transcriptional regulator
VSRRAASDPGLADHPCIPRDSVDRLIADWGRVRPDLDVRPVAIITRLERLRGHIDAELERVFESYGLSGPSFAVLVSLARLNEPGGVSQRRLMAELGLTSGTVSVRMDRLVEQRLVDRQPDPDDKRNTRITLTDAGRVLFERVAPAHLANERRLLSSLSETEQELLATLLRKLLVEYEGSLPPPDAPVRLGLTLAPVHVTMSMRGAVGLPPVPGLLVREVADGGPASAVGLRQGDVLVRAGQHELRSVAALYAAIAEAAGQRSLELEVVRGTSERVVSLTLADVDLAAALRLARTAGRAAREEHVL